MTSKKRRQRGSRTHSGGSHKNRRGAGHRGGRGRAGRSKHEFHNYEPKGKHGFKRPQDIREDVLEIDVQKLDEDAILYVADDLAEETGDGYELDARDIVEDGHEADVVKVLGSGQVRNQLTVTADAFSDAAEEKLEAAGGEAVLSERGEERAAEDADAEQDEE
ncbi:uL15m family ribosomal protein [Natrinema hispanicum]|uniref:Large ribosomal subunit protein uL15 n=1 Tax=Natrinema hispanicum TaxID=392421 RepID=A0A1G6IFG7_9EURY|nr:uL15m family ribosomal protein [Natrinema hispanicum]SDC05140.1 LSU ribosomal protein L15P [Natrinema hispanicum]SES84899.1 LSU ribosomal protein L15P [Natrinema hispanicum]